jgi:hypothetical protein
LPMKPDSDGDIRRHALLAVICVFLKSHGLDI